MKKKLYQQPEIKIRKINMEYLLAGGSITDIYTDGDDSTDDDDTGIDYGGGGTGPAYAPRSRSVWDEF